MMPILIAIGIIELPYSTTCPCGSTINSGEKALTILPERYAPATICRRCALALSVKIRDAFVIPFPEGG